MKTYKPTVDELRDQGLVFYEVVAGSQSHGTNTPKSDIDTRGYYHVPMMR
jgi:predicted nucleotidyltransferase